MKLTTKIVFKLDKEELWNNLPEGIICHKKTIIKRRVFPDEKKIVLDTEKTHSKIEEYLKKRGVIEEYQYLREFWQVMGGSPVSQYEVCEDVEV